MRRVFVDTSAFFAHLSPRIATWPRFSGYGVGRAGVRCPDGAGRGDGTELGAAIIKRVSGTQEEAPRCGYIVLEGHIPRAPRRAVVVVAFPSMKPVRSPLFDFPDVLLHADELAVKRHPKFQAAKAGDVEAADALTSRLASSVTVERLARTVEGRLPELVPIHALESEGVNEIPAALANVLSRLLGLPQ